MGDVLKHRHSPVPELDGSLLPISSDEVTVGAKINRQFMTQSSVDVSFKAAGVVSTPEGAIAQGKAGLIIDFGNASSMYLKVLGLCEHTIKDMGELNSKVLTKFASGGLSAQVYVIRGMLMADRFFLQFGGTSKGQVGLELDADINVGAAKAKVDVGFKLGWSKAVGFDLDALNGGPLGYRVSAVRIRRPARPQRVTDAILKGATESEATDTLTLSERAMLIETGQIDMTDCTDELICNLEDADS